MIIVFSLVLIERNIADFVNDLIGLLVAPEGPRISLLTLIGLW